MSVLQEISESIMNLNLKLFGFQNSRNETSRKYTILWPAQFQNVQGRVYDYGYVLPW